MRAFIAVVSSLLLTACSFESQPEDIFPKSGFTDNENESPSFSNFWSSYFEGSGEGAIFEVAKNPDREVYRFSLVPSFHRPVCIHIEVFNDAVGELSIFKGLFYGFDKTEFEKRVITEDQIEKIRSAFDDSSFWGMQPEDYEEYITWIDGEEWILEARVNSRYHLVARHMQREEEFQDISRVFFDVADFTPNTH